MWGERAVCFEFWRCGEWGRRHTGGIQNVACGSFVRLRTHEFLSHRGKEPKAAGGRRGFHAARRPPAPPQTSSLCRWSLAGALQTVSLRFRTNGPVENVPFSTRACAWRREGAAWVGRASHADFLWRRASEKASPERGGAREAGGGVPFPHAVTTTKPIGDAPTFRRN